MHLIRRAAFRAASSPSTSFVTKSRSISTNSPFLLRSKVQSSLSTSVLRRFASDDAHSTESGERSEVESSDSQEQSSISSAINSATESASSYVSDATESLTRNAEEAKDTIVDAASGVASAAGFAFGSKPREPRQSNDYYNKDNSGRNNRYPSSSGFGGSPTNSRFEPRSPVADRVLSPSPTIYVGNLLFDVTQGDLEKEFEQYGKIKNVIVAADARGLSKGFGYVEFETTEQATAAIEARHETMLEGRRLIVNYMAKTQRKTATNPPSKTLFIGNLAFEMSDGDLNKLFRDIRNVIDVRVAIDRRTGQPRGFAHADFVDVESAVKGFEQLAGKEVYGRKLRVDYSTGGERRVQQKAWDTNETRPGPRDGESQGW